MGRHSGPAPDSTRREMMYYVGGLVASALVWAALVSFAIKLGSAAKGGSSGAWFLIVVATLGAITCMALALLLGARAWELRTGVRPPARPVGGRRVKR